MYFENGITIIGSGNLAWHLAYALKSASVQINTIISRSAENAKELADKFGATFSNNLEAIPADSSLLLLCVSDNAIEEIAGKIAGLKIPVAHTAGSIPILSQSIKIQNTGVLYPLLTFSKKIRLGEVSFPIFIEASDAEMHKKLEYLAHKISNQVYTIDSEQRKNLHLAGVLVNNFSNYLYTKAFDILESKKINGNILLPLIEETTVKLRNEHPKNLQTGPAKRGDLEVIRAHEKLLAGDSDFCKIYSLLSHNLMEYYKKAK
jgi:predicted short-subunit dehydrogenase-like oxidoreductase (DUF2520 family)